MCRRHAWCPSTTQRGTQATLQEPRPDITFFLSCRQSLPDARKPRRALQHAALGAQVPNYLSHLAASFRGDTIRCNFHEDTIKNLRSHYQPVCEPAGLSSSSFHILRVSSASASIHSAASVNLDAAVRTGEKRAEYGQGSLNATGRQERAHLHSHRLAGQERLRREAPKQSNRNGGENALKHHTGGMPSHLSLSQVSCPYLCRLTLPNPCMQLLGELAVGSTVLPLALGALPVRVGD